MERFIYPPMILLARALQYCILNVEGMWDAEDYEDIRDYGDDMLSVVRFSVDRHIGHTVRFHP